MKKRLTHIKRIKHQINNKRTMRKLTFKTSILSLAALCGLTLTIASCANEDIAQNGNGTDNDKNLTIFSTGEEPATRTSMESNGTFYWEAGDKIWVKDDNGAWRQSSNSPSGKTASFKFKVPGKFTKGNTYKVYYPGQNGNQNQVTIAANQTQTEPNSTAHFGTSGDCGTADAAWSNSKNGFSFTLDHQAAYLIFQPYTGNSILHNCFLTKIEVNSDDDITDTYTLSPSTGTLTGTGNGKQIILTTKGSGSYGNGFPLTNTSASITTNGAYMVIKPGTHTLKVRYWLQDVTTNVEGTITKTLTSTNFEENKYYNITANFDVRDYDGYHYYMWDAKKNYWDGHEWDTATPWQPVLNNASENTNYPKYGEDRFYKTVWRTIAQGTAKNMPATQNPLFTALPNVNEMSWYVVGGDPYYDTDELWTTMGHLYKGGVWIKKKSKIAGFNSNADHNGVDWRSATEEYYGGATGSYARELVNTTNGQPANTNDYFYLPALGMYDGLTLIYGSGGSVTLKEVGQNGYYWTSTGTRWDGAPCGYNLKITPGRIFLSYDVRTDGNIAQPTWFK